jgi:hypothetical protein
MNTKVAAIAVVAVLLVAAGGGAAFFLMKDKKDDDKKSLDGMYVNIGKTDTLAVYNVSKTNSAPATANAIGILGDNDSTSDVIKSLYKKNANGQFEPVKFFKSKEAMDSGDNTEVTWLERDYSLSFMEYCEGILHIQYGDWFSDNGTYRINNILEYFIDTETGKIYEVANGDIVWNNHSYGIKNSVPFGKRYAYIGEYNGEKLFYRDRTNTTNDKPAICSIKIVNDVLTITELINGEQFSNLNNEVIACKNNALIFCDDFTNGSSNYTRYVRFADGTMYPYADSYEICDGYLCNSVTYNAYGIPTAYEKFTTGKNATEVVNLSAEDSFRIAGEDKGNQLYRYTEGNDNVIITLKNEHTLTKTVIKSDLTSTVQDMDIGHNIATNALYSPVCKSVEGILYLGHGNTSDTHVGWYDYNVVLSGKYLYFVDSTTLYRYDMTDGTCTEQMNGVTRIDDVYSKDGTVFVKGLSVTGGLYYASIDPSAGIQEKVNDVVMGQITILPLN